MLFIVTVLCHVLSLGLLYRVIMNFYNPFILKNQLLYVMQLIIQYLHTYIYCAVKCVVESRHFASVMDY